MDILCHIPYCPVSQQEDRPHPTFYCPVSQQVDRPRPTSYCPVSQGGQAPPYVLLPCVTTGGQTPPYFLLSCVTTGGQSLPYSFLSYAIATRIPFTALMEATSSYTSASSPLSKPSSWAQTHHLGESERWRDDASPPLQQELSPLVKNQLQTLWLRIHGTDIRSHQCLLLLSSRSPGALGN